MTAQPNYILRHILDEAIGTALRVGVPLDAVAATLVEVLVGLSASRAAATATKAAPAGETREAYIAAHVAHQITDSAAVLILYAELMEHSGARRAVLMEALRAMTIEPAASAAHRQALRTVERLLTAQALVHAVAAWAELMQPAPPVPPSSEIAPCAMH